MVHPQHVDAHFGASWKLEPAQFGFFTTLSNLHHHPKCIQQCTQRSQSEDAQEANMSQARWVEPMSSCRLCVMKKQNIDWAAVFVLAATE